MNDVSSAKSARKAGIWIVLLVLIIGAIWYWLSSSASSNPPASRRGWGGETSSVRVVPVEKGSLDVQLHAIGTVTALNTVTVRSRVDGMLEALLFEEGAEVEQGELLARIDPAPYQAQLEQAQGQLQQNQAQLENAEVDLKLYRDLYAQDSIARQQLDSQAALVRELQGANKSGQAQLDEARLQLSWTDITAPISGRLGLRRVDAGNLITANDSEGLVSITQTQPISVFFTIPEGQVSPLRSAMRSGEPLRLEALDRNEQQVIASGRLVSLDNQIDTTTGTLRIKGEFANDEQALFPNQFINVRLRLQQIDDALTIPVDALQHGSQGTYVYVVEEGRAFVRQVEAGIVDGDRVAITAGLKAGERVVLEGLDRLRDGREVLVEGDASAAAAGAMAVESRKREGGKPAANAEASSGQRASQPRS